ncbi:MAG: glycosyltransferase family 2 protein [Candidatus Babeliales bacterium]
MLKMATSILILLTFKIFSSDQLPIQIKYSSALLQKKVEYELPLVVLICSYNNAPWVKKNLDSVCMQHYTNWRIVYFDDASTDDTYDLVIDYVHRHNISDKCTLITAPSRGRKLKNLYTAFHHYIDDHEIIVQLDGDDWFAHENVFSCINTLYQKHDIWMSYGNYQNVPNQARQALVMDMIPEHIVENRLFRQQLMFMHLRTFYGWLAKQIRIADLMSAHLSDYKSNFYPASNDAATIWPMFEMAWHRFAFIEEIMYYLNRSNPINGFKVDRRLQRRSTEELQVKIPVYKALQKPILNHLAQFKNAQADCLILSHNNPEQLNELFHSLDKYAQDLNEIWLFYQADTQEMEVEYRKILLDNIHNVHNFSMSGSSININLQACLESCTSKHLLICSDSMKLNKCTDLSNCIVELERTGAYGFYLSLGHNLNAFPDQHVWGELYASKFNASKYAWFNSLDMTVMRKADFLNRIHLLAETTTITDFITAWEQDLSLDISNAGLYYTSPKTTGKLHVIKTILPPLPDLPRRRKQRKNPFIDTKKTPEHITIKRERRIKKRQLS